MRAATTDLLIVQVPINDLRPAPANPRKISDAELDALTRSVREFGFVQPVVALHDDRLLWVIRRGPTGVPLAQATGARHGPAPGSSCSPRCATPRARSVQAAVARQARGDGRSRRSRPRSRRGPGAGGS